MVTAYDGGDKAGCSMPALIGWLFFVSLVLFGLAFAANYLNRAYLNGTETQPCCCEVNSD